MIVASVGRRREVTVFIWPILSLECKNRRNFEQKGSIALYTDDKRNQSKEYLSHYRSEKVKLFPAQVVQEIEALHEDEFFFQNSRF